MAFKTVREVEYLIKTKGNKITNKRHVLKTNTENFCPKGQAEKVFPDMTYKLQSSVLSFETVKKDKELNLLPISIQRNGGITIISMDKLALMESNGLKTHIADKRSDIQFEEMRENLSYNSKDNELYINSLYAINSTVSLISKEKSGLTNKIEVKEEIKIKLLDK